MTNVKICGITNIEDAAFAVAHGAWALGFNFYPASPRFVSFETAHAIIAALPSSILKVGLFISEQDDLVIQKLDELGLDFAQVYTDEARPLKVAKRMILALQATEASELPSTAQLAKYAAILLDAPKKEDGLMGGTGRRSNWALAKTLAKHHRLMLAGGLTPDNVQEAITMVRPYAVDVSSGVERQPGVKDHVLLNAFLEVCDDA